MLVSAIHQHESVIGIHMSLFLWTSLYLPPPTSFYPSRLAQSPVWTLASYSKFPLAIYFTYMCSVQFSHSVLSNSLQPHGLQYARLFCPSPTPRAYSNSCPLSWWYHPTISSSVVPFSCCLQSFLALGSFQWVSSSHQVAKVLEFQLQPQSFQWIFRIDFL